MQMELACMWQDFRKNWFQMVLFKCPVCCAPLTQGNNMNVTAHASNFTSTIGNGNVTLLNFTATAATATAWSQSFSSDSYSPELTIMVVLGLSLLLAGLAAFLAVCRPSDQEVDSETSCSPGESSAGGRGCSSEPQLKVWKRLGSYRRSCNLSFRRPLHRRPHERESARASPPQQTLQQEARSAEPHVTVPCLFDYVTEIWVWDRLESSLLLVPLLKL